MSSIQNAPVEVLLDVFHAIDPAGTEALQLTCRRFHSTILQNVDTLPTRVVCDLAYFSNRVYLCRTISVCQPLDETIFVKRARDIAVADESPKKLQNMYRRFGCKTTIRRVVVAFPNRLRDARLMHLIDNFPSVKKAMRLDISYWDCKRLPTDAALHHFERLETIVMDAASVYDEPSFWSDLFAVRAFRRVPNFLIVAAHREYREEVDAAAVFDFITDFSLMPTGKPRVVSLGRFNNVNKASLNAVKRRLNKNNASIGGQACVVIRDLHNVERYLSNMASGGKLRTLAKKLLRKASGVPAVNHV